jgi:hypothetical protein
MILFLNLWLIKVRLGLFESYEDTDGIPLPLSCGLYILRRDPEDGGGSYHRLFLGIDHT